MNRDWYVDDAGTLHICPDTLGMVLAWPDVFCGADEQWLLAWCKKWGAFYAGPDVRARLVSGEASMGAIRLEARLGYIEATL